MANIFTLDSLREELENEYAPLRIPLEDGEAVLPSILRLEKKVRKDVTKALKEVDRLQTEAPDDIDELEKAVLKVIGLVAGSSGPKLIAAIGDDLALTMRVFTRWTEGSQPGEASNSPS